MFPCSVTSQCQHHPGLRSSVSTQHYFSLKHSGERSHWSWNYLGRLGSRRPVQPRGLLLLLTLPELVMFSWLVVCMRGRRARFCCTGWGNVFLKATSSFCPVFGSFCSSASSASSSLPALNFGKHICNNPLRFGMGPSSPFISCFMFLLCFFPLLVFFL